MCEFGMRSQSQIVVRERVFEKIDRETGLNEVLALPAIGCWGD